MLRIAHPRQLTLVGIVHQSLSLILCSRPIARTIVLHDGSSSGKAMPSNTEADESLAAEDSVLLGHAIIGNPGSGPIPSGCRADALGSGGASQSTFVPVVCTFVIDAWLRRFVAFEDCFTIVRERFLGFSGPPAESL